MQLLASVLTAEAGQLSDRFRANGIPVLLVDDHAHPDDLATGLSVAYRGASPKWQQIYVCLDEQYEEAKQLLGDPNCQVKAPVDIAAFDEQFEKLAKKDDSARTFLDANLNWIVGGLLFFLLMAIFVLAL